MEKNNNGNVRLRHVKSHFTIIPNSIIDNPNLSFRAKGIYTYLRSKPDSWEFKVDNIAKVSMEGRDAVRAGIKELENAGYLEKVANKQGNGKFSGWIWIVYETPIISESDGLTENPFVRETSNGTTENPSDGKTVVRKNCPSEIQEENSNTILNKTILSNNNNNMPTTDEKNNVVVGDVLISSVEAESVQIINKVLDEKGLSLLDPNRKSFGLIQKLAKLEKDKIIKLVNELILAELGIGFLVANPNKIDILLDGKMRKRISRRAPQGNNRSGEYEVYVPDKKVSVLKGSCELNDEAGEVILKARRDGKSIDEVFALVKTLELKT